MKSTYLMGVAALFLFVFVFSAMLTSIVVAEEEGCVCCVVYCDPPYDQSKSYEGHLEWEHPPIPDWCNSQPTPSCPNEGKPGTYCVHFAYLCP